MAALVVAIVGAGDRGGETASSAAGGAVSKPTITIAMNDDFTFSPVTITVPTVGAIIHLVNNGNVAHDMEIPGLGLTSPVVNGQEEALWEIGPFTVGEYEFN